MDMTAIGPATIQLDNLKWETVDQSDIGIDLALFDDRLMITAEWYKRVTNDLLQKDIKLPSSTGFAEMKFYNSGRMENKGWELILTVDAVRQEDFSLAFNLKLYGKRNEVLEIHANLQF